MLSTEVYLVHILQNLAMPHVLDNLKYFIMSFIPTTHNRYIMIMAMIILGRKLSKLEQLERLRSEIPPAAP